MYPAKPSMDKNTKPGVNIKKSVAMLLQKNEAIRTVPAK